MPDKAPEPLYRGQPIRGERRAASRVRLYVAGAKRKVIFLPNPRKFQATPIGQPRLSLDGSLPPPKAGATNRERFVAARRPP
jgi:hypothetical protein